METSVEANKHNYKVLTENYEVSKNIPIDKRFLIDNLANLDVVIPVKKRYPGLIFFVPDAKVNDGTDDVVIGELYTFESDLTKPISLRALFGRYQVRMVTIENGDYSTLLTKLNKTFAVPGNMVLVNPLNVVFIYNGTNWEFFKGNYNITDVAHYDTIPNTLKKPGEYVYIGNATIAKLIKTDLTLSDVIIVSTTITPDPIMEFQYYSVNGFLYFGLNGKLWPVHQKIFTKENLVKGENRITHNLNSIYINCKFRIYNNNNPHLPDGTLFNIDQVLTTSNKNESIIYSDVPLTGELIITAVNK